MTRLLKVVGVTADGQLVSGHLLYGRINKGKRTYYVKTFDDAVIECVECVDDKVVENHK